jgi:hypothetical protein
MGFDDYKVVLYRNQPEGWVAEIPAIPGCHALADARGGPCGVGKRIWIDFGGVPLPVEFQRNGGRALAGVGL